MSDTNKAKEEPNRYEGLDDFFSSLTVNQNRLMRCIHEGCEFGQAHRYGRLVTAVP